MDWAGLQGWVLGGVWGYSTFTRGPFGWGRFCPDWGRRARPLTSNLDIVVRYRIASSPKPPRLIQSNPRPKKRSPAPTRSAASRCAWWTTSWSTPRRGGPSMRRRWGEVSGFYRVVWGSRRGGPSAHGRWGKRNRGGCLALLWGVGRSRHRAFVGLSLAPKHPQTLL